MSCPGCGSRNPYHNAFHCAVPDDPRKRCDYCTKPAIWFRDFRVQSLQACADHQAKAEKDWDRLVMRFNVGI